MDNIDEQPITINSIKANVRNYRVITQCEMQFLHEHATEDDLIEIMKLLSYCMEVLQRNVTEILSTPRTSPRK